MEQGVGNRRAWLTWLGLSLCATARAQAPQPKFVMSTDAEDGSYYGLWMRRIYAEALQRLGLQLEPLFAPPKRASLLSEQGQIDGEMVRAPVYAAAHPELVMVDMPMIAVTFGVYAQSAQPGIDALADLAKADGLVAFRRGVVTCQSALKPLLPTDRIVEVTSTESALGMLARGHARFVCELDSSVANTLTMTGARETAPVQKLFDVGAPLQLYPYLHGRHAALAPKLAATLRQMKSEGMFERYRVEVLRQMSADAATKR